MSIIYYWFAVEMSSLFALVHFHDPLINLCQEFLFFSRHAPITRLAFMLVGRIQNLIGLARFGHVPFGLTLVDGPWELVIDMIALNGIFNWGHTNLVAFLGQCLIHVLFVHVKQLCVVLHISVLEHVVFQFEFCHLVSFVAFIVLRWSVPRWHWHSLFTGHSFTEFIGDELLLMMWYGSRLLVIF